MNTSTVGPHILVVQHPDTFVRSFHVTRKMLPEKSTYRFGDEHSCLGNNGRVPVLAKSICDFLKDLPGVKSGSVSGYEVCLTIGETFNWRLLGPGVLGEIIYSVYPDIDGGDIEISTKVGWHYFSRSVHTVFNGKCLTHYEEIAHHVSFPVQFNQSAFTLDVEHLLDLDKAKTQAEVLK